MTYDKSEKREIVAAVQNLLRQGTVTSQEEICQILKKQGLIVNQARISRILHQLGAIKVLENDKAVYQLPTESINIKPSDLLEKMVLNVVHNESTIVIHTSPGSAHLVARILDQHQELGILGTVAGDDTILVVPHSIKTIKTLTRKITQALRVE